MKAVTLRDIPGDLARRIHERARSSGASLNRTIIEMLQEPGTAKRPATYDDLDALAGNWSEEEEEAFARSLEAQRAIEPSQWS